MAKKSSMTEVSCIHCDKLFKKRADRITGNDYCSQICFKNSRRTAKSIVCDTCGLGFDIVPANIKEKNYCSYECHYESKRNKVEVECTNCGKIISKVPSKVHDTNFCSQLCSQEYRVLENHHNWKGGSPKLGRSTRVYLDWRLNCMERDNFICNYCGTRGGDLEVHHILSFARYPAAREVLDNGTTLCKTCHREFHYAYGFTNFTREDYFEWLKRKQKPN